MPNDEQQQYIIRNRDEPSLTSVSMSVNQVIKASRSGHWGSDCLIDEIYLLGHDIPQVLRRVAIYSSHIGFQIIESDKEFSNFFIVNDITEPKSPALNESRALFK